MTDTAPAQPGSPTIAEVITKYLRHSELTGRHSPKSRLTVEPILRAFAEAYGELPVDQARAFLLSDWIEARPSWKATGTRSNVAKKVNAVFNWAVQSDRIGRNPIASVGYDEGERRVEMSDDTLRQYCLVANRPFERALRFLRYTGCRLGELCRARWEDVDLDKGVWRVHVHKSRKRTGKPKVKALTAEAVKLLRDTPRLGDFIFLNTWNRPYTPSACEGYFRHLRRDVLKLPASTGSLHSIRHRFAGAAVAAGAPLKLVAEQLGHASVRMTEKYYLDLSGQVDAVREAVSLGMPKAAG
jgi:integrase